MTSPHALWVAGLVLVSVTGCGSSNRGTGLSTELQSTQRIKQLENRLVVVEQQLRRLERSGESDSKAPAGPLQSLTLRVGSTDDRLRMYWSDGQTSDLVCNQEGQGTWACG